MICVTSNNHCLMSVSCHCEVLRAHLEMRCSTSVPYFYYYSLCRPCSVKVLQQRQHYQLSQLSPFMRMKMPGNSSSETLAFASFFFFRVWTHMASCGLSLNWRVFWTLWALWPLRVVFLLAWVFSACSCVCVCVCVCVCSVLLSAAHNFRKYSQYFTQTSHAY